MMRSPSIHGQTCGQMRQPRLIPSAGNNEKTPRRHNAARSARASRLTNLLPRWILRPYPGLTLAGVRYLAFPSQPELWTLQAARRPGPAVASHLASAPLSAERRSSVTDQPTPGVPSAGSIETAKHLSLKVLMIAQSFFLTS